MPDPLLPSPVRLTEASSIALVQAIQRQEIFSSLSAQSIATAFVQQGTGGTPIVLLHGFDSSVLEFRRLFPLLAAENETWIVDLLGFGFTDRPADVNISPAAIKTHLHDFWKALIDCPIVLVGASMGGAAAIDFALTYPHAVAKLVLIDSAGFAKAPPSRFLFPPLGYLAAQFLRSPRVRRKVSLQAYHDPSFVTADVELCAALHLASPRWSEGIIAFTKSGGYNFLADKIPQIQQPTLILWGDRDRILGTADAEKFRRAIDHAKFFWIENCGHVPHLEQPHLTAQHILGFVINGYRL